MATGRKGHSACVLIVDDVAANLWMLESMLSRYGLATEQCVSGLQALERAAAREYDLILMDHIMPEMDGPEAVSRLRKRGWSKPVIAMTARADLGAREMYIEAGFDDYISKPIHANELERILKEWIPDICPAISEAKLVNKPSGLINELREIEELDVEGTLERIGGSAAIYERTVRETVQSFLESINKLGSLTGMLYAAEAHKIKGALYNIGAAKFGEQAGRLEKYAREGNAVELSKRHTLFVRAARKFMERIKEKIDQEDSKAALKPDGEIKQLLEAGQELETAASRYDYGNIVRILGEISEYRYGAEADAKIAELILAARGFDYERIREISEGLASFEQGSTDHR